MSKFLADPLPWFMSRESANSALCAPGAYRMGILDQICTQFNGCYPPYPRPPKILVDEVKSLKKLIMLRRVDFRNKPISQEEKDYREKNNQMILPLVNKIFDWYEALPEEKKLTIPIKNFRIDPEYWPYDTYPPNGAAINTVNKKLRDQSFEYDREAKLIIVFVEEYDSQFIFDVSDHYSVAWLKFKETVK